MQAHNACAFCIAPYCFMPDLQYELSLCCHGVSAIAELLGPQKGTNWGLCDCTKICELRVKRNEEMALTASLILMCVHVGKPCSMQTWNYFGQ